MNLTLRGLPPVPGLTLLDRLVTYVSPFRGLRRYQARAALAPSGWYSGARYDRRALQEWYAGLGSADRHSLGDLATLCAWSRDLPRNAPLTTGALNTVVTSAARLLSEEITHAESTEVRQDRRQQQANV